VLSTIAVLTVVGSWNAFLLPLLFLIQPEQWTLPLGINNISAQYVTDTAMILAYTTLATIPALVFYNHFAHRVKECSATLDDFALEFLNIAERNFT